MFSVHTDLLIVLAYPHVNAKTIDDCAKDGGEEFFTEMQCVLLSNSYRIVKDLRLERDASR